MAELHFSWRDISELTKRLSSVAHELTEVEWALLLAIFAAAAERVESGEGEANGTLPAARISDYPHRIESPRHLDPAELRNQLLHAYIPGSPVSVYWAHKITPPDPQP
jgi:hypothetical protein